MQSNTIADLVVLAADRPDVLLIVEVKSGQINRSGAEEQLKRYMLARRCPVALLVTPSTTWVYRDSYRDYSESSVDGVAEVPTRELLGPDAERSSGLDLERRVFDWLDRLSASSGGSLPSSESAKAAVVKHVAPAVAEGRVMLQHPAA